MITEVQNKLEYKTRIGAGQRKIVHCEIDKPFQLTMFTIERDVSEAYSVWFDNVHMKSINVSQHSILLKVPVTLTEDFSLISSNLRSPFGEIVEVTLYGKYV